MSLEEYIAECVKNNEKMFEESERLSRFKTNRPAFKIQFTKNITRSQFIVMCNKLTEKIGNGFKIRPDLISEGGFIFSKDGFSIDKAYKAMRFYFGCDYPYIRTDVMIDWINDNTILIPISNNPQAYVGIISNYIAPKWTTEEIEIFKQVFIEYGAIINIWY